MIEKSVVFKCKEQDIVELIQKRFDPNFDSIVADQEIGNQDWVTSVSPASDWDFDQIEDPQSIYMCDAYMNVLCSEGKLEAGEYIVDCTW